VRGSYISKIVIKCLGLANGRDEKQQNEDGRVESSCDVCFLLLVLGGRAERVEWLVCMILVRRVSSKHDEDLFLT
jgi:hypothetical protein